MSQGRAPRTWWGKWQAVVACSVGCLTLAHVLEQLLAVGDRTAMVRLRIDRVGSGPQWQDGIFLILAAHTLLSLGQLRGASTEGKQVAAGRYNFYESRVSRAQWACGLALGGFLIVHIAQFRAPLWSGTLAAADVEPLLVASLSSTWAGIPLQAGVYLGALAVAAVYASRGAMALLAYWGEGREAASFRWFAIALGSLLFLIGALATVLRATGLSLS